MTVPLIEVHDLSVDFELGRSQPFGPRSVLHAAVGVDLDLYPGEVLGVVGESGCGKLTLARAILRLVPASGGSVLHAGVDLLALGEAQMRRYRRELQIIFQDPLASRDPRMTVEEIVTELLRALVPESLERVGISTAQLSRYPHEFSGGQTQRIGIARALVVGPRVIVCDEPTSALDVSIKAKILNLLRELQRDLDLSLLFITHDLATIYHLADRVIVLCLRRVVETASARELYANPRHPYRGLLTKRKKSYAKRASKPESTCKASGWRH